VGTEAAGSVVVSGRLQFEGTTTLLEVTRTDPQFLSGPSCAGSPAATTMLPQEACGDDRGDGAKPINAPALNPRLFASSGGAEHWRRTKQDPVATCERTYQNSQAKVRTGHDTRESGQDKHRCGSEADAPFFPSPLLFWFRLL